MRILLIHPEGNINYNINLVGILEILTEAEHHVTYLATYRPEIFQEPPLAELEVILLNSVQWPNEFILEDLNLWRNYDLIIAVDRGIIESAKISRKYNIPHCLLSYEIIFPKEVEQEIKAPEIEACRDILFAIGQDSVRSEKLSQANLIEPEKIFEIPVAGRGFSSCNPKPRVIHEMFNLGDSKKIVLHMGSFAKWSGAEFLLESTQTWSEDWMLVIHERFGRTEHIPELINRYGNTDRILISLNSFDSLHQLSEFVSSADLGVALYQPTYENSFIGANIGHIGLSSSKIGMFLQHGVPVATHNIGEISDLIESYGAGQIFSLEEPFIPQESTRCQLLACKKLFETHLNLDKFCKPLVKAIENIESKQRSVKSI